MKNYEKAEMELIEFEVEDVITTSDVNVNDDSDDIETPEIEF